MVESEYVSDSMYFQDVRPNALMTNFTLTTPVAFIIYNRPEVTSRVFRAIREARPTRLLIVADGPGADRPDDQKRCAEVRRIVEIVDWPCDVMSNCSDINLGCVTRVSTGITWIFDQVEEAIILEDDCLPAPSFFRYCQELLTRYRHDERVAMIRGDNWPAPAFEQEESYRFSHYPGIWGWASWRRVWKNYDVNISGWSGDLRISWLRSILGTYIMAWYWQRIFDRIKCPTTRSTWDYQLILCCWEQGQYSIIPSVNLISNIGGGEAATHTTEMDNLRLCRPLSTITFPLRHPEIVSRNLDVEIRGDLVLARCEWWLRKVCARFLGKKLVGGYGRTF